ncbi:hypothetical protein HAX54_049814 [Datura stramonium]|uniref:Uncharacterized protein n=1 Tax=Datura stramonium TaxID=4076 RepID=A0ABS8WKR3_DATST|nr:hypothetical protein [Datura stramonium]
MTKVVSAYRVRVLIPRDKFQPHDDTPIIYFDETFESCEEDSSAFVCLSQQGSGKEHEVSTSLACKLVLDELANMEEGDPKEGKPYYWEYGVLMMKESKEVVNSLSGLGIILGLCLGSYHLD